jgi:hypothetical protein
MTLTAEQTRRVEQSIVETQRALDKELSYRADLQDAKQVAFYRSHIAKLQGMLA